MTKTDFLSGVWKTHILPALQNDKIRVDDNTTTYWYGYLGNFKPGTIKKVMTQLSASPRAYDIRDACRNVEEDDYEPDYQDDKEQEKQAYNLLKARHRAAVNDFRQRIMSGTPLTEKQCQDKELIDKYMAYSFGERDLKTEFKDVKTPFCWSYFGLYMNALEDRLDYITGVPKGDIGNFNLFK